MRIFQTLAIAMLAIFVTLSGNLNAQDKKKTAPVEGTFKYGSKTHQLKHVVAYQSKLDDVVSTVLFLSEKPMPKIVRDKLVKELKAKGHDEDLIIFQAFLFVRVELRPEFEPTGNVMLANGGGFNIASKIKEDVEVAKGNVVGSLKMAEEKVVFDQKYFFQAKVNAPLIHTIK